MFNIALSNYSKALIRVISLSIILFLLITAVIFYAKLSTSSESFIDNIQKNKISVQADFKRLHANYVRQIKFIKRYIEQLENDVKAEELEKFFNSSQALILDRSNINTIIITDKDFNIKFLDQSFDKADINLKSKQRSYLQKVAQDPDQVVLGEIVEGILSHSLSIPLALGIKDQQGNFAGSIIFSINLASLNKDLIKGSLCSLLITDDQQAESNNLTIVRESSRIFFLKKVLLTTEACTTFELFDKFSNKYLYLGYDIRSYRQVFFQDIVSIIIPIAVSFIIIIMLIYFYIFAPIRSVSPMMEVALQSNNITDSNFFNKLAKFVLKQSYQLQEQNLLYKQQEGRLASILYLSAFIAKYISNKSENLTEDIEDVIASNEGSIAINYQNTLKEIQQISLGNEQDIKSILNASIEVLDLIKNQHKEPVDIYRLIKDLNIGAVITVIGGLDRNTDVISKPLAIAMLYRELFNKLIQEILFYEDDITKLAEIKIDRNKAISFIFDYVDEKMELRVRHNFIRCKTWGALNNIRIKVFFLEQKMVITIEFCEQ